MRSVLFASLAVLVIGSGAIPVQAQSKNEKGESGSSSLIQVLEDREQFSTLVSVVEKANMDSVLASQGNLTVLAPTNEAFASIDTSVDSMDKSEAKTLLLNQLVPAALSAKKVAKKSTLETLAGNTMTVDDGKTGVEVGSADLKKTNIQASNGIIHAVDTVLVPTEIAEQSDGSAR